MSPGNTYGFLLGGKSCHQELTTAQTPSEHGRSSVRTRNDRDDTVRNFTAFVCTSISESVKHMGVKTKVWAVLGSNALYMR